MLKEAGSWMGDVKQNGKFGSMRSVWQSRGIGVCLEHVNEQLLNVKTV